jgi:hypothetical protein
MLKRLNHGTPAQACFHKKFLTRTLALMACSIATLLGSPSANAAPGDLYAATASGIAGELYTINPATGSMVVDIGPLNDTNGVNYPITGLAFHPVTGVLYGSTGNSVSAVAARLVTIDPATGVVTPIGSFNVGSATMTDLAFDATGNLYGVGSSGGPQLYSINLTTGKATLVGASGLTSTSGGALAISRENVFYGSPTLSRFGTYSPSTGVFANIANPTKPVGGAYAAMSFDSNGTLYGLNLGPDTAGYPTEIVRFDLATGAVTDIAPSVVHLDSIAFQPMPKLAIASSTNQITVQWPVTSGVNLEYNTNLSSGTWVTNAVAPTVSNGTYSVTLPTDKAAEFYRLHKP